MPGLKRRATTVEVEKTLETIKSSSLSELNLFMLEQAIEDAKAVGTGKNSVVKVAKNS